MFRYPIVVLLAFCGAAPASASSWASGMFEHFAQDFGSVARGATLTHSFSVANRTGNPVHIASVRVSCGCTSAAALENDLAPGKETAIFAQMDTRRFAGMKTVTIFVLFDRPEWDEVRLSVTANSREDVGISPESFTFGRTRRGLAPTASVSVGFAGNGNWQILDSKCDSAYVETSVRELGRDHGQVSYLVAARVRPDTPAGRWYTDVWLTTNDCATARLRVPLTVEVEPALSVNPHVTQIADVRMGDQVERKIVIRGEKAFRITGVEPGDNQLSLADMTPDAKPVHVLTIRFKPNQSGVLHRTLRVSTDLNEEAQVVVRASAK